MTHFNFADFTNTHAWGVTFGFTSGNRARFNVSSDFVVTSTDGVTTIHNATLSPRLTDGGNSLLPNGDNRHTFNARPMAGNNVVIHHARGRRDHVAPCDAIWSATTNGGGHGIAIVDPAMQAAMRAAVIARVVTTSWGWVRVSSHRKDTGTAMTNDGVYGGVYDRFNQNGWDNVAPPTLNHRGTNRVDNPSIDALVDLP
jgi:hypothetical protein